jgi:hypothetical protein
MNKLRLWTAVLIIWLIFFFNIERIGSPINIRSYTYVFVAVVAALTLLIPRIQQIPLVFLIVAPVPLFLALKAFMEKGDWHTNLLAGYALPLTVTQASAIILTGMLARQINQGLGDLERIIANITFGHIGKLPRPFSEGQGVMYREVKRARRYQRPLAVIALTVDESTIQLLLPETIKKIQQALMKEYVLAGIARILDDNMFEFDTIALRDNSFVLVLPEVAAHDVSHIIQRIEKSIKEQLEVKVKLGAAALPDDAVTFESLVEMALENAE